MLFQRQNVHEGAMGYFAPPQKGHAQFPGLLTRKSVRQFLRGTQVEPQDITLVVDYRGAGPYCADYEFVIRAAEQLGVSDIRCVSEWSTLSSCDWHKPYRSDEKDTRVFPWTEQIGSVCILLGILDVYGVTNDPQADAWPWNLLRQLTNTQLIIISQRFFTNRMYAENGAVLDIRFLDDGEIRPHSLAAPDSRKLQRLQVALSPTIQQYSPYPMARLVRRLLLSEMEIPDARYEALVQCESSVMISDSVSDFSRLPKALQLDVLDLILEYSNPGLSRAESVFCWYMFASNDARQDRVEQIGSTVKRMHSRIQQVYSHGSSSDWMMRYHGGRKVWQVFGASPGTCSVL